MSGQSLMNSLNSRKKASWAPSRALSYERAPRRDGANLVAGLAKQPPNHISVSPPETGQPRRAYTQSGLIVSDSAGKPVSRILSLCGHSSRRRVATDAHQRPTRRFRQLLEPPCRIGPMRSRRLTLGRSFPPYLVLLRVGFTLPPPLPSERCALTAPFHPYLGTGPGRLIQFRRTGPGSPF